VPTEGTDGWVLAFPGGEQVAFDDGLAKTFEEKLEAPDLEDMLVPAYPTGPIEPVNTPDVDPGRFRNEALFMAAYGGTQEEVESQLVDAPWLGQTIRIHERAQQAFAEVEAEVAQALADDPSLSEYTHTYGAYFWKYIMNTTRLSMHSFGIAMDLDNLHSYYWESDVASGKPIAWNNQMPQLLVDIFEKHGFIWGGRWYHYDTMHFEYRPEMFDPDCAP